MKFLKNAQDLMVNYPMILLFMLSLLLAWSEPALAVTTTFVVDNAIDNTGGSDVNPGDCICQTDDLVNGLCSLRAAIQEANDCPSEDIVITFGDGVTTYALLSNLPQLTNTTASVTIDGAGVDTTIIDGQDLYAGFSTLTGTNLTLKDLTIQNMHGGDPATNSSLVDGVAVNNLGTLAIDNAKFSGNTTTSNNSYCGVIRSDGSVTVTDTTFSDNTTEGCDNGVINIVSGTLTVDRSTFSNNSAGSIAGGIYIQSGAESATISNSTFVGNDLGLQIYNLSLTYLNNVTISANSGQGTILGSVGILAGAGVISVQNSIISGNNDDSGGAQSNCAVEGGQITSAGYNIFGSNCLGVTTASTDLIDTDITLDTLADNGGSTQTVALTSSSIAVNAGNPDGCTTTNNVTLDTDQTGNARSSGGRCDIGAFEYQFADADGDGYYSEATPTVATDCDDTNENINPGEADTDCTDGINSDCSSTETFYNLYTDADEDGHGDASTAAQSVACNATVAGSVSDTNDDCDDTVSTTNPDRSELCSDSADNDCDGSTDESDCIDASDDNDGDGTLNDADEFPFDASETVDTDHDGTGDNTDTDDDDDGVLDIDETAETTDSDGDDIVDASDTDDDDDGILDESDTDDDGDGAVDTTETAETTDTDGDGTADADDVPADGDAATTTEASSGCSLRQESQIGHSNQSATQVSLGLASFMLLGLLRARRVKVAA